MKKILLILLILFTACSSQHQEPIVQPIKIYPIPWITWDNGYSLDKNPLNDRFISRGDQLFDQGKYFEALEQYYKISAGNARISDFNESLQLRIASALLALDEPQKALDALSSFYEKNGKSVTTVRAESALMFAYVYGRLINLHQSLAWFSQALRDAKQPNLKAVIEKGVMLLLARIPEKELGKLREHWDKDYFLRGLIQIELARRSKPGVVIIPINEFPRFWEVEIKKEQKVINNQIPNKNGIMVLLPLTGRYASFGQAVKQGIELALGGDTSTAIPVVYRDDQASPTVAAAICSELAYTKNYSTIIGPLLYTTSQTVAECAKRHNLKMFSFTKKAEFLEGQGVYRLGVDAESQMASVVKSLTDNLGFRKYAIAYPAEETSQEFVREFKKAVSASGGILVSEYSYYRNPIPDFRELGRELGVYNPQALFLVDNLNNANRVAVALGPDRLQQTRLIGTGEWSDLPKLMQSASSLSGVIFPSPFFESASGLSQQFVNSYKKIYNKQPDFLAAQGFDAATVVKAIVGQMQAGNSWENIISSFRSYNGLTGKIQFSGPQKLYRNLKVVEFVNGGLQEINKSSAPDFVYRGNNEQQQQQKEEN